MDELFDERQADKRIIRSALKTSSTLWEELEANRALVQSLTEQIKRSQNEMFIKSTDGKFYRVEAEQEVSADEVQACLDHCQAEAAALQALVAPAAPVAAPAEQPAEQPVAPAEQPAQSEQPAQPEQPVEQPAPAEQAAPAADPNAALPEQPAAPADPNALPPLQ